MEAVEVSSADRGALVVRRPSPYWKKEYRRSQASKKSGRGRWRLARIQFRAAEAQLVPTNAIARVSPPLSSTPLKLLGKYSMTLRRRPCLGRGC